MDSTRTRDTPKVGSGYGCFNWRETGIHPVTRQIMVFLQQELSAKWGLLPYSPNFAYVNYLNRFCSCTKCDKCGDPDWDFILNHYLLASQLNPSPEGTQEMTDTMLIHDMAHIVMGYPPTVKGESELRIAQKFHSAYNVANNVNSVPAVESYINELIIELIERG